MKQNRRRNRTQIEGEELIAEYVESGMTQCEFCELEGISVGTLAYWLRKVGNTGMDEGAGRASLVEVQLINDGEPRVANEYERPGYEIILSGERCLRIPPGFDADEVAVLITVLEGDRC
jgi:transposase-like protein